MDLDQGSEMIIFESYFNVFVLSVNFLGGWGSGKNWLEPKPEPPLNFLTKLVKFT
jgi:hypothetical protein